MSKNCTCGEPQSVHSNLVYSAVDKENKAARPKIAKEALILNVTLIFEITFSSFNSAFYKMALFITIKLGES